MFRGGHLFLTRHCAFQAWHAIVNETVRQGSALPALQAVYAASNRRVHIAQRTLQRLCFKLAGGTGLEVPPDLINYPS